MKPPYVIIDAVCQTHGKFRVERKPNKYCSDGWTSKTATGFYLAVRCPVCPLYATKIIKQTIVTAGPDQGPDQSVEATLPGLS